jgi:hypothetical protein
MVIPVKGCIAPKQHLVAGEVGTCGIATAANAAVGSTFFESILDWFLTS